MYLDHEDLVTFCGESDVQSDAVLKGMDGEIMALKRLVSFCKFFCFSQLASYHICDMPCH